jgi:hypothetical protein
MAAAFILQIVVLLAKKQSGAQRCGMGTGAEYEKEEQA